MKIKTRILSFIGGLVFFSTVATVLIVRNEGLRKEFKAQAGKLVDTGRSVVGQMQVVVNRVGRISNELNSAKQNSNIENVENLALTEGYDALWTETELKSKEHTAICK